MAEIVIIAVLFTGAAALGIKYLRMKQDIYDFGTYLDECLDQMIAGKEMRRMDESEESMWGRTYDKLKKLDYIWKKQNQKNIEEKKQMKELISDISHQTRTPSANMKLYLEILTREDLTEEERRQFLRKIQLQEGKLEFLMESLVKMSRLETGVLTLHMELQPFYETLARAVAAIVPKAEKKEIMIYVDCAETLLLCHDRKWTEEAVFNLLDNAVKYTEPGGEISISAKEQEIYTKISIRDTGKGIEQSRQAEIFQRFYREPEVSQKEGIGIGLYLTRKIITVQNGYIEVHSEPGKGAEFQIYLPRKEL